MANDTPNKTIASKQIIVPKRRMENFENAICHPNYERKPLLSTLSTIHSSQDIRSGPITSVPCPLSNVASSLEARAPLAV